jgi:two-component system, NtrC family, nitrogen regulation response regulator NtrX
MVVVARAMETSRLRRENIELRRRDVASAEMLGSSAAFKLLKSNLDKVTKSNGRVMLTGEPGSGKEMAARYIHTNSGRATEPFIIVSSASIEPERMEEVLFGRETPERGVEPGLLEQAHGGVVYFDEVGDMPLGTQGKILRVLTEQQFTRAGGTDKVRVDLRVISSTCRDLKADIGMGRFRQELYDRLNVVPIAVPSLAERREDIPELTRHFIDWFHKTQGLPKRMLATRGRDNAADHGLARQHPATAQHGGTAPDPWRQCRPDRAAGTSRCRTEDRSRGGILLSGTIAALPLREARELFEREYLLTQINRFGGNISRTASFVGMERSALHRKLKSLGVVGTTRGGRGLQ